MSTKKQSLSAKLEKEYGPLSFGALLRAIRTDMEMDQKLFSKKLGLTVSSLSDLERGRKIPSPERAAKIAQKLKQSELGFIELAVSDSLKRAGFNLTVRLKEPA